MAGSVKGIIVEIGGDTSGLQKALSKVNSATSSLSKELRGINSLLKLDPKNTELLSQKQTVLNQRIATTEEKLKQLQEIKNEADKKMAEGTEINAENYRSIQREIINTQNKLSNLKNEASNWNKSGTFVTNLGTELTTIGKQIDSLGNKLTTRVSVPLIAGFGLMTKSAIENETAMQQVNRIYADASKKIKDFAENQAVNYNMSSSDAYKYSQIYGNLIQSITDDQNENAEQTQKLLKASSIIASATGRTMEDVMDRVRSGLLGNTEAIEDLGVNVNVSLLESTDAFKKFAGDKSWNQLDFQTQQQIRLIGILEQTSKKYGDEVNNNTASSVQKLTAKTKNLTANLGDELMPIAIKLIDKADKLVDYFGNLSDSEQENIVKMGLMIATAGPLLKIAGTGITVIGQTSKGIGTFTTAIGLAKNGIGSTTGSAANLAKVFMGLTSPIGIATMGITASIGLIVAANEKMTRATKEAFSNIKEGANEFALGIEKADSYLSGFNSTLFASSEEQHKLQEQMNLIQQGITTICKTASDERRGYTQEEISQLDEYFTKLRELKDKEIQIQQSVGSAITQQAKTQSDTFSGSLEEYKIKSQEWIKTAEEHKNATTKIIQDGTIEEIALLNQRYTTEESRQSQAYKTEYNNILTRQQKKIDVANNEVAKVNEVYTNGYLERQKNEGGFLTVLEEYRTKQQNLENAHNEQIRKIKDGELWYVTNTAQSIQGENETFAFHQKENWNNMYKNMTEEQEKELGSWLARLAQTEMYGGEISTENKEIVDTILASYDSMPEDAKKTMDDTMEGMLNGMKDKEPSLFEKATNIADGVLSKLRKCFDIHSPSKKTRKIFNYAMEGAELGMDDKYQDLMKKTSKIADDIMGNFAEVAMPNISGINKEIIEQTRTVFTTPNLIINANDELTPSKINNIVNAVNRRLGSKY